ncbi:MAG: ABC transporter permease [Pseudorhodoplanes sp.]
MTTYAASEGERDNRITSFVRELFLSRGILPFVLVAAIILFGAIEPRFLGPENAFNIARQSTFLMIVCMGQMMTLLVRGIDMSVGSTVALISVVTSLVISGIIAAHPDAVVLAIAVGIAAALATGMVMGAVHGISIAYFNVNPFIMTVGTQFIAFGIALKLSGGVPIYGLPPAFSTYFVYMRPWGIPMPAFLAAGVFIIMYFILNWTKLGRHIYAIGGDPTASHLAGIHTKRVMIVAYIMCSVMVAFAGVLLTARTESGEATLGGTLLLDSIAAVVIAGVSLFGGIGKVGNVIFGALFVTLVTNGMNLIRIDSYTQQIVLGLILIGAVLADRVRMRILRQTPVE